MTRKHYQASLYRIYRAYGLSGRRAFNMARVAASRPSDF